MFPLRTAARLPRLRGAALTVLACMLTGGLVQMAGCAMQRPAADPGPSPIALDARPNGIAVHSGDGVIYMTDDASSSVLRSSDGHSFSRYAGIPAVAGQDASLSQLAFDADGNLLVGRFGFGSAGAVFSVGDPDRVIGLAGLDPARRRLGLAPAGPHRALSTWFVKNGDAPGTGGLSLLEYNAATGEVSERDLITDLGKPVGVVVLGFQVFVADQARNVIDRVSLPELMQAAQPLPMIKVFAHIEHPDLMVADESEGTLYTRCKVASFCRIEADGTVSEIATGFHDARGVALNISRRELYVVDRAAPGGTSYLRTVPLH
jgi:hypothetical protein